MIFYAIKKCDGDFHCGNKRDEKYCRLTEKWNDRKYTDDEIIRNTKLLGGLINYKYGVIKSTSFT